MIADACYNVLEKPTVTAIKMKATRDTIFEILAILIKQYNNAISCKVKIVQVILETKLCLAWRKLVFNCICHLAVEAVRAPCDNSGPSGCLLR